ASLVALGAHVRARVERRGEPDERRERHEEDVERIDEELLVEPGDRPGGDHVLGEPRGGGERREAEGRVDLGRAVALAQHPEAEASGERHGEDEEEGVHQSSLSFSRWWMSSESNCSRIWNRKTPRITMPTSTSSAMPSSTTIGMP